MKVQSIPYGLAFLSLFIWSCGSGQELAPAAHQASHLEAQTGPATFAFVQSSSQNRTVAIANAPDGSYVTGGIRYTSGNGNDAWVLKFDASGDRVWERRYGTTLDDSISSLTVASNGDILFTGSMREGSLDGSIDVWLVRLSSEGDILWQKAYGGISSLNRGGYERARALIETKDGNIVVVGDTNSFARSGAPYDVASAAFFLEVTGDAGDIVQSKALVWSRYYNDAGRRNTNASSIVQTADSGFAVAGDSDRNFWATKLSRDGTPLWMNHYGYTTHDHFDSLVQDTDGHLVMAGSTCNTAGDDCDVWTVKAHQASGDFVWVRKFDGATTADTYTILKSGLGFVVAGAHRPVATSTARSMWLVQMDGDGNLGTNHPGTWQKTYGGQQGSAVALRPEGGFLFAGHRRRYTGSTLAAFFVGTDATGDVACPVPVPTDVSSTQGVLTRAVCPLPPTGESCCTDAACGTAGNPRPDTCETHETCVSRVCIPKPVDWVRDHVLTARDTHTVMTVMSGTKEACQ